MTSPQLTPRALAELSLLALLWGGVFLAVRIALDEIAPLGSVLLRVGLAAAGLWAVVLLRRLPVPRDARTWGALAVMGLLNNVLPFSLMAWAQLHIPSGLTSILNASTAVFGVIVAAMVFADERLMLRRGFGVALGFAGVVTAIGPEALASFDPASLAQLAVLFGTLSYAFAAAWGRVHLRGLPPLVAAAGMLTGSTLLLLPITAMTEGLPPLDFSARAWGAVLYYALVATSLAYLLYYRVLAMAGSGNLMLVTLMIPPVAIALGALVRGEALSHGAYAGFALLALGLAILDGRVLKRLRPARRV